MTQNLIAPFINSGSCLDLTIRLLKVMYSYAHETVVNYSLNKKYIFLVWNIRTNSQWSVMTLVGHSGTVRCLHLLGNRLVSGSTDLTLKVWDLSVDEQWSSIGEYSFFYYLI